MFSQQKQLLQYHWDIITVTHYEVSFWHILVLAGFTICKAKISFVLR